MVKWIHIDKVQKWADKLRYVTKEDTHALHAGCSTSDMSLNFRVWRWARDRVGRGEIEIDPADFMMIEHHNHKDILHTIFYAAQLEMNPVRPNLLLPVVNFGDWRDECIEWWNQRVIDASNGAPTHKAKQLYIVGPSNTGKTLFVDAFLTALVPKWNMWKPVLKSSNKFPWQSFDAKRHQALVLHEFDLGRIGDAGDWKQALAGEEFAITQKFKGDRNIKPAIPMIFTSNTKMRNSPEFTNRLLIVSTAKGRTYQCQVMTLISLFLVKFRF